MCFKVTLGRIHIPRRRRLDVSKVAAALKSKKGRYLEAAVQIFKSKKLMRGNYMLKLIDKWLDERDVKRKDKALKEYPWCYKDRQGKLWFNIDHCNGYGRFNKYM